MKPKSTALIRIVPAIIVLGTGTAFAQTTVDTATDPVYQAPQNILQHTWTGAGTLTFQGPGNIGLDDSGGGNRNYFEMTGGSIFLTGDVYLKNGGWQGGDWSLNNASMDIGAGSYLDLWDGFDVRVDALTGSGTVGQTFGQNKTINVGVNGGSGSFAGTIINGNATTNLAKHGDGTQTLTGLNSYTGGTNISAGILAFDRSDDYGGNFTSNISGNGGLTLQNGTLVLAGNNAGFGGNIVINGGTLAAVNVGSGNFGQSSASRTITVNNGGTLDFRRGDVFGNHLTTNMPDIIINSGGTVTNKAGANVNPLNNVILNGGTLTAEAGFGAADLRAWSLNGNITSTGSSTISDNPADPNSGINMESNPTIDVQSGTLNLSARLSDKALGNGASGITKQGAGTLVLAGTSTYTGATNIDAGTLLVTGELGATNVSVGGTALIGGDGTVGGTLHFASGAGLVFSLTDTLTVSGASVSFESFSIANLSGFGNGVPVGTYFLLDGDAMLNTANLGNLGAGNSYVMGDTGKQAYFTTGSLNLVVIPEPGAALLGGLGLLALLRRRRV
jgi:autotransporter-associated beta strand protein